MKHLIEKIVIAGFVGFCVILCITAVCWGFDSTLVEESRVCATLSKIVGFAGCVLFPIFGANVWNEIEEVEEYE